MTTVLFPNSKTRLAGPFEVVGTQKQTDATGATTTVFEIKPYDTTAIKATMMGIRK